MQVTTLSFQNMHVHGPLLADLLRARHRAFIVRRSWDLPQADGMEFDQYDPPASRWIVVHDAAGRVMAGCRLTPTTHRCGMYSYMIRDAQAGLLGTIPRTLLFGQAPVAPHVWECSRGFVSCGLDRRERVLAKGRLHAQMIASARELGASSLLTLVPASSPRLLRLAGVESAAAGPVVEIDGAPCVCLSIPMGPKLH
jgi:N-acyl-L-homoserine lactone synthetase